MDVHKLPTQCARLGGVSKCASKVHNPQVKLFQKQFGNLRTFIFFKKKRFLHHRAECNLPKTNYTLRNT